MEKLKHGENVQKRQLQTWLSEDEYEQVAAEWDTQKLTTNVVKTILPLANRYSYEVYLECDY